MKKRSFYQLLMKVAPYFGFTVESHQCVNRLAVIIWFVPPFYDRFHSKYFTLELQGSELV